MKKISVLLLFMIVCATFTNCGGDDKDSIDNGNAAAKQKRIMLMTIEKDGEIEETIAFTYDSQGRLVKKTSNNHHIYRYTYTDNQILLRYNYSDWYNDYTIDGNRIISVEGGYPATKIYVVYSYDNSGYLSLLSKENFIRVSN